MKQKFLKMAMLPIMAVVAAVGILSFTESSETGGNKYDTKLCQKWSSDSSTVHFTSACNIPATDGPCDTKKDCPEGYN